MYAALNNPTDVKTNKSFFCLKDQAFVGSADEADNPEKVNQLKRKVSTSGYPFMKYRNVKEMGNEKKNHANINK